MIDTTRWIVAETWLSLGLRLLWSSSYDENELDRAKDSRGRDLWQSDESGARYAYNPHGHNPGVWVVRRAYEDERRAVAPFNPPQLTVDTMVHELAHYLVSTADEREKVNFGLGGEPSIGGDREEHAQIAERTLLAVIRASSGIAALALKGAR